MTIEEMRRRRKEIAKRMRDILDAVKARGADADLRLEPLPEVVSWLGHAVYRTGTGPSVHSCAILVT